MNEINNLKYIILLFLKILIYFDLKFFLYFKIYYIQKQINFLILNLKLIVIKNKILNK